MGVFDFVANAGEKLFGDETPDQAESERDAQRTTLLKNMIEFHGFRVKDLDVQVEGDVARIAGTVRNAEDRGKIVVAAGNVAGIGKVEDNLEVEEDEAGSDTAENTQFHTVEKGETLSKISDAYYGDPMKYSHIFEANQPMLTDPDKIYPGQVLRIPPPPKA